MEVGGSRHFPFTVLSPNNNLGLLGIPLCEVGAGGHDDIFAQGGVIITVANKPPLPHTGIKHKGLSGLDPTGGDLDLTSPLTCSHYSGFKRQPTCSS